MRWPSSPVNSPCCNLPMWDNTAFYRCACGRSWIPVSLTQPTQWEEIEHISRDPDFQHYAARGDLCEYGHRMELSEDSGFVPIEQLEQLFGNADLLPNPRVYGATEVPDHGEPKYPRLEINPAYGVMVEARYFFSPYASLGAVGNSNAAAVASLRAQAEMLKITIPRLEMLVLGIDGGVRTLYFGRQVSEQMVEKLFGSERANGNR